MFCMQKSMAYLNRSQVEDVVKAGKVLLVVLGSTDFDGPLVQLRIRQLFLFLLKMFTGAFVGFTRSGISTCWLSLLGDDDWPKIIHQTRKEPPNTTVCQLPGCLNRCEVG